MSPTARSGTLYSGREVARMRTAAKIWALSLALLTLGSCTGWRVAYLRSAVDQATQQDVMARLGPPDSTEDLTAGGTAWTYRIGPPEECVGYILISDREKVLRVCRQESC
jgi:hypothetical protein